MKTFKITYNVASELRYQLIKADSRDDALRIAREKYNIVALRCEEV